MIKLEGIVLNVFTQQGGQNKKAKHSTTATRFKFLALWNSNGGVKNELFTLSVEITAILKTT